MVTIRSLCCGAAYGILCESGMSVELYSRLNSGGNRIWIRSMNQSILPNAGVR